MAEIYSDDRAPQVNINPPAPPQVNVNATPPVVVDDGGDRTAAAAINFMTVLVILGVIVALAVLAWYLLTGPLANWSTNINIIQPAPQAPTINVNPPAPPVQQPPQQQPPQPAQGR